MSDASGSTAGTVRSSDGFVPGDDGFVPGDDGFGPVERPNARVNLAARALALIMVAATLVIALSVVAYRAQWSGDLPIYRFLRDLGIDASVASHVFMVLSSLVGTSLWIFLASVIALLVLGAVRWQRTHVR